MNKKERREDVATDLKGFLENFTPEFSWEEFDEQARDDVYTIIDRLNKEDLLMTDSEILLCELLLELMIFWWYPGNTYSIPDFTTSVLKALPGA